jgi:hypothetical protein
VQSCKRASPCKKIEEVVQAEEEVSEFVWQRTVTYEMLNSVSHVNNPVDVLDYSAQTLGDVQYSLRKGVRMMDGICVD